jgi:hypothetical protein
MSECKPLTKEEEVREYDEKVVQLVIERDLYKKALEEIGEGGVKNERNKSWPNMGDRYAKRVWLC